MSSGLTDFEHIRNNPSAFVEEILDVDEVFGYQQEFLDSDNRFRQFVTGRQTGKSRSCAWAGLAYAVTNPSSLVLITAPSLRQSSNLFKTLRSEMSQSGYSDSAWGVDRDTQTIIELDNDSEIVCLPVGNNGDKIRGYTADQIIVDEAAFVPDVIYEDVLRPMTFATEGNILLASTPFGTSGFFYDAYIDDSWHTVQAQTSDNPLVSASDLEEYKEGKTKTQIKQEILGEFVESKSKFFTASSIRNVLGAPKQETNDVYLGADIAAAGANDTVFVLTDSAGNVFDIRSFRELGVLGAADKISLLDKQYGFQKVAVDRGGLGQGTVEALAQEADIAARVEDVYLTIQRKQEIYQSLKASIESEELLLPNNSKILRDQLKSITYSRTSTNNLSLSASGDNGDDYADALALCVSVIPDTVGDGQVVGPRGSDAIVSIDDVADRDGNESNGDDTESGGKRQSSRVASGGSRRTSMTGTHSPQSTSANGSRNRNDGQNGRRKARRVRDRNRRG